MQSLNIWFKHQNIRPVGGGLELWQTNLVSQPSPGIVGFLHPEDLRRQHREKGLRSTGAAEAFAHHRPLNSHHQAKAHHPDIYANCKDGMLRSKTVHRQIRVRKVSFSLS